MAQDPQAKRQPTSEQEPDWIDDKYPTKRMEAFKWVAVGWIVTLPGAMLFHPIAPLPVLLAIAACGLGLSVTFIDPDPFGLFWIAGTFMLAVAFGVLNFTSTGPLQVLADSAVRVSLVLFVLSILSLAIWEPLKDTNWLRRRRGLPTKKEELHQLTDAVQDLNNPERADAVVRLGWRDNLEAQDVLVRATRDPDPAVRDMAVLVLLEHYHKHAPSSVQRAINSAENMQEPSSSVSLITPLREHVTLLLHHIFCEPDSEEYAYALKALLRLGDETVPILFRHVELLEGRTPPKLVGLISIEKRGEAALVLGQMGNRAAPAVPALIAALSDEAWRVRLEVIEALGRIGDPQAVPALIAQLGDSDPEILAATIEALAALGDLQAIPALQQMPLQKNLRDSRKRPLADIRDEAIATLHAQGQE